MENKSKVTKWIRDNTDLDFKRSTGDGPQIKLDSLFVNRKEAYEIRDLIYTYYTNCNLAFTDKNFSTTFKKIMSYKAGIKVKRDDMLDYLTKSVKKD